VLRACAPPRQRRLAQNLNSCAPNRPQDALVGVGIPARLGELLSDADRAVQTAAARCLAALAASAAAAGAGAGAGDEGAGRGAAMLAALLAAPVHGALWAAVERYPQLVADAEDAARREAAAAAAPLALTPRSRASAAAPPAPAPAPAAAPAGAAAAGLGGARKAGAPPGRDADDGAQASIVFLGN
jgi:hypothetical protein